jgi:hypothetical protein
VNNTIEKDHKKLDLLKYDLEFDVDPLFKNMTARFNETGARGLLLNSLPIDVNLNVMLESKENEALQFYTNKSTQITSGLEKILAGNKNSLNNII